jgi:hypothetical protein
VVADIPEEKLEKHVLKLLSGVPAFSSAKEKADATERPVPRPSQIKNLSIRLWTNGTTR